MISIFIIVYRLLTAIWFLKTNPKSFSLLFWLKQGIPSLSLWHLTIVYHQPRNPWPTAFTSGLNHQGVDEVIVVYQLLNDVRLSTPIFRLFLSRFRRRHVVGIPNQVAKRDALGGRVDLRLVEGLLMLAHMLIVLHAVSSGWSWVCQGTRHGT